MSTQRPHIAAIDFDSQGVYVAVGTRDTTSLAQPLLRADAYPNDSIRRGTVMESQGLTTTVGQVLRTLEGTYQYTLPIFVGVHPSSMKSRRVTVSIQLTPNNTVRPITESDCDMLEKKTQALVTNENPNTYILSILPRQYTIDATRLQVGGSAPVGYQAMKLSCEFLVITCLSQDVTDYVDTFENFNTHVYDVMATPLTASFLVTEPRNRMFGCGVLYVSSEVTSFILFEDGVPAITSTFPIGVNDIVADVAAGLQMDPDKARALLSDHNRLNEETPAIRKRFQEIVSARYMDFVEITEKALTSTGQPVTIPAGITLVTTNIQLPSMAEALKLGLKVLVKLWEGDIPSVHSKKRSRDISIIGAYSIICFAGSARRPINNTRQAVRRIWDSIKTGITATIRRFLS